MRVCVCVCVRACVRVFMSVCERVRACAHLDLIADVQPSRQRLLGQARHPGQSQHLACMCVMIDYDDRLTRVV